MKKTTTVLEVARSAKVVNASTCALARVASFFRNNANKILFERYENYQFYGTL